MPAMEGLLRRMRHLAMLSPGIEAVVNNKARQMGERVIGGGNRRTVSGRVREQLAGHLHRRFLHKWGLVLLHELSAPGIDLLVDVDLHRADVGAAAVESRRERQVAV